MFLCDTLCGSHEYPESRKSRSVTFPGAESSSLYIGDEGSILCFGEGAQAGAIAQAGFTDYIFKF